MKTDNKYKYCIEAKEIFPDLTSSRSDRYLLTARGNTWEEFYDSAFITIEPPIIKNDLIHTEYRRHGALNRFDRTYDEAFATLVAEFNRVNNSESNLPSPKMIETRVKTPLCSTIRNDPPYSENSTLKNALKDALALSNPAAIKLVLTRYPNLPELLEND